MPSSADEETPGPDRNSEQPAPPPDDVSCPPTPHAARDGSAAVLLERARECLHALAAASSRLAQEEAAGAATPERNDGAGVGKPGFEAALAARGGDDDDEDDVVYVKTTRHDGVEILVIG